MTVLIIAANMAVHFYTWAEEREFFENKGALFFHAYTLTEFAQDPVFHLKKEFRERWMAETVKYGFPTKRTDRYIESVQERRLKLPPKVRGQWEGLYKNYQALKRKQKGITEREESTFWRFGYFTGGPLFPGLVSYQFLHAGFLHLFFNMLFLWLVGCNIEERWGAAIFTSLYVVGGAAAALLQSFFAPSPEVPLVGASGAVAVIMGAFLVRHYNVHIKIFYFAFLIIFKFGTLSLPAWVVLPAWFLQQLVLGAAALDEAAASVGYWAHSGGFAFGAGMGLLIHYGKLARAWEKSADATTVGARQKVAEGREKLDRGEFSLAEADFQEVLQSDPAQIGALEGLLEVYHSLFKQVEGAAVAVRLMQTHLLNGGGWRADRVFNQWKRLLSEADMPDDVRITLAQTLDAMGKWMDALQHYQVVAHKIADSTYTGKALYSAGKLLKDRMNRKDEAAPYFRALLQPPHDLDWGQLAEAELHGNNL